MARQALLARLDDMIERLSGVLSDAELRHGWTDRSRLAMLNFFENMRRDAAAGKSLKTIPNYVSIVRGLDHYGISGGALFQAAAEIGDLASRF
jgi:hypothetical protein